MSWYRTGTVAVTNGSTVVTGTGTLFAANNRTGDAFIGPDGKTYEVTNIPTETTISIAPPYLGATASGQLYAIAPMQGYVKASADRLRQATDTYGDQLESLQPWATADTPAEARTLLGLGTASTANVTTGATDTASGRVWRTNDLVKTSYNLDPAAGRMLQVGDFGVGGLGPTVVNANTMLQGGLYSGSGGTGINFPTAGAAYGPFIAVRRATNPAYQHNLHFSDESPSASPELNLHYTKDTGATWTNVKIWSSANQINIGTTAATARTAIDTTVFPSYTVATVPSAAANPHKGIKVTNAASGQRPYWSNGTDWRDAANVILS